jgi:hypothetical protein
VFFRCEGIPVEILVTKEILPNEPIYKISYITRRYVIVGGESFPVEESISSSLYEGLIGIRESFDISKYKSKGLI